jgi:hypothetical protein
MAMQIYWLLRTISQDQRGPNKVISSLLQSCEEAATHAHSPECSAQHRHTHDAIAPAPATAWRAQSAQPGVKADACDAPSCSRQGNAAAQPSVRVGGETPSAAERDRLSRLSLQLGNGEGVTQLVQASMDDLSSGGTGLLSRSPPGEPVAAPKAALSTRRFKATVDFLDILCACSSSLLPIAPPQRMSALRQRLEGINARLLGPDLHAQARRLPFCAPHGVLPCPCHANGHVLSCVQAVHRVCKSEQLHRARAGALAHGQLRSPRC